MDAALVAPAPPERPNAVQLDLGLGVVGLAYERFFERRIALQLEGHVFGTWFGPMFDLPNMSGFGGQARPTFFLSDEAPKGFYVAPFVRIDRVTTKVFGVRGAAIGFSAGTFLGYSFMLGERMNVRLGAGLQVMSYTVDVARETRSFETVFPALDAVVGYTF